MRFKLYELKMTINSFLLVLLLTLFSVRNHGLKQTMQLQFLQGDATLDGLGCAVSEYKSARGIEFETTTEICNSLNKTWFSNPDLKAGHNYFELINVKQTINKTKHLQMPLPDNFRFGDSLVLFVEKETNVAGPLGVAYFINSEPYDETAIDCRTRSCLVSNLKVVEFTFVRENSLSAYIPHIQIRGDNNKEYYNVMYYRLLQGAVTVQVDLFDGDAVIGRFGATDHLYSHINNNKYSGILTFNSFINGAWQAEQTITDPFTNSTGRLEILVLQNSVSAYVNDVFVYSYTTPMKENLILLSQSQDTYCNELHLLYRN